MYINVKLVNVPINEIFIILSLLPLEKYIFIYTLGIKVKKKKH